MLDLYDMSRQDNKQRLWELRYRAIVDVLSSRSGRRFVYAMLQSCGMTMNPYDSDSDRATAYHCGRMSVGNDLLKDIRDINQDAYYLMLKEAKEEADYVNGNTSTNPESIAQLREPDDTPSGSDDYNPVN